MIQLKKTLNINSSLHLLVNSVQFQFLASCLHGMHVNNFWDQSAKTD